MSQEEVQSMIKLNSPIEHPHIKAVRENVLSKHLSGLIDQNDLVKIKTKVSNALNYGYGVEQIFPPGVNRSSIPDRLYLECAQLNDPSIHMNDIASTEFEVIFDPIDGILKIRLNIMVDRVGETQNAN